MTQFQKPLVQANGCIQYPLAMQCAICFSHLHVASLALARFFCQSFATCVAIAFARNASLPFRCHVCCQGLLLATQILPFNLPPVLLPLLRICQCFFATDVAITFAPVGFFHPCCPADCHRHCHCHCFCPQSCHLCCHQIWAPNRALFLNFR